MNLLNILLSYATHLFLLYYQTTVSSAQVNHSSTCFFDTILHRNSFLLVQKSRYFFPRKRSTILTKVSFTIKTLIESIKKTAIKYFIKAFQEFKLMLENQLIGLVVIGRNLDDYWFFLQRPERVKNSVWNHHYIRLIFFSLLRLYLLWLVLVHVSQHFKSRWTCRNLQVFKYIRLLPFKILDQAL